MNARTRGKIIRFPGAQRSEKALTFRIQLMLVAEPVWRRLIVPGEFTFWDFHVAIQDVMGWQDIHRHEFRIDDPRNGQGLRFGIPDDNSFHGAEDVLCCWEHSIGNYFRTGLGPALYTYDFGDDWQHEVTLESISHDVDTMTIPACLDGKGACPHEDCGGPFAWEEYLAENAAPPEFRPDAVVFDNPRARWQRSFGHD